jgi:release factor glutamine methyltransferase
MTLRDAVNRAAALLADAASLEPVVRADAARESRLLIAAVLQLSPAQLAQRLVVHNVMSPAEAQAIEQALHRRLRGEPLAYAVGTAAFRELELQVDHRVLIPRPETEVVVGEALRVTRSQPGGIAVDIGTGSGAIALSLAAEGHFDRVIATDVSADALDVARLNAERVLTPAMCPVEFRAGADLAPLAGIEARVIVSNPPYIAYEEAGQLPSSVRDWEPPVALFAPEGGMARYITIIAGALPLLERGGWLVLETDARRAQDTATLAADAGYHEVQLVRDLSGRDRVLLARRPT